MRTKVILIDDCGDGVKREIALSDEEALGWLNYHFPPPPKSFWRTLWDYLRGVR